MFNAAAVARGGFACLAAFAVSILSGPLAQAEYGPRTVFESNYQQTSNTTSNNGRTEAACNSANSCYVLFQRAPGQKKLIIRHVSCVVNSPNGALKYGEIYTRKGSAERFRRSPLSPVSALGDDWIVNSPVMHLISSNERPSIRFHNSTLTFWDLRCSISGTLLNP
jgi:hypothetical protein